MPGGSKNAGMECFVCARAKALGWEQENAKPALTN